MPHARGPARDAGRARRTWWPRRRRRASSSPAATGTSRTTCSRDGARSSRSSPGRPDLLAEVAYAARREQARTVGDVLLRRTRLGLTAARRLLAPGAADRARRGGDGGRAGVGRGAPRAGGSGLPRRGSRRRHPARAVSSCRRNFRVGLRRLDPVGAPRPGAALPRRLIVPAHRRLRRSSRPRPRTPAGSRPPPLDGPNADVHVGRQRRPRARRHRRGRLPAQRRRRPARVRLADVRRRLARAGARRRDDRRGRPRSRSRPATATGSRSPGSRTANVYATVSPGGDTPGGFAPAVADRRPGREDARHRPRRQRRRLRGLGGGRQRRAPRACRTRRGRAIAPPLDVDPALRGRHRARCARRSRSRPRATPSRPGATRCPDGSTRVWARRITGMNLSVVPQDLTLPRRARRTRPTSTSRTTARSPGSSSARTSAASRGRVGRRLIGSQFEAPEIIDGGHRRRRARRST